MITIRNKTKKFWFFKALGLPTLRLFPGLNNVDEKNVDAYFESPAASARAKTDLESVGSQLTAEERKEAEAAKAKNDEMNRAAKILKQNEKTIKQNEKTIKGNEKTIADLEKKNEDLEKRLAELEKFAGQKKEKSDKK